MTHSRMPQWLLVIALASMVCLSTAAIAQQSSRTATLRVSASVVGTCNITVTPLNFGNYDPTGTNATQPLDGASTLSVTCTRGTIASVSMDDGGHYLSGIRRAMVNSSGDPLRYDLFQDASRTTRWGIRNESRGLSAAPSSAVRTYTIYGRVAGGQDVAVGSYQDVIVVGVTF